MVNYYIDIFRPCFFPSLEEVSYHIDKIGLITNEELVAFFLVYMRFDAYKLSSNLDNMINTSRSTDDYNKYIRWGFFYER